MKLRKLKKKKQKGDEKMILLNWAIMSSAIYEVEWIASKVLFCH
jgi:hypothetical protein